jgi:hypothetical protein
MDAKLTNKLRSEGAQARAAGQSVFRNPLFDPKASIADTESFEEWRAMVGAWLAGWEVEDAIRGPLVDPFDMPGPDGCELPN